MTRTTTAAVVSELDGPFQLDTVHIDDPRPREVLVRTVAAGMCHTDLSVRAGLTPFPLPGILGHEGAGVVEAVGSAVERVRPGDHVLLSFTSCGVCAACSAGFPSRCESWGQLNLLGGRRSDGSSKACRGDVPLNAGFFGQSSFSQLANVDERCVVRVPSDLPLEMLAPLGCGIQTGFGTVVNVMKPEADATVVIFGAGAVGLAAVMAAKRQGVRRLIVVDRVVERLDLAADLGASHVVDAGRQDAGEAVVALTSGRGADYTLEATGNTDVLSAAISELAPGGMCAIVGAPRTGAKVSIDVKFMMRSRSLVGVTEGDCDPLRAIPDLIAAYQAEELPIERIITHYPFADIEQAAEDAHSGKAIKPVLLFDHVGVPS